MDYAKLRAWWWHKQGLDGSLKGRSAAEVLERSGWARSVGGVGPYLTLFSRAGISREEADRAVANLEVHELPSARGCTYVLPASDFALGLAAGQGFNGDIRVAGKLGVTAKEIDKLCRKVADVLDRPMDPEEIRQAVGGAARNLGEEGKKKGMITTLPVALGELQSAGKIRRVPVNGRLDQQRYRYARWSPSPLEKFKLSREEVHVELARRYFRWTGPATIEEFQWFSALGVKASKEALAPLGLVPLASGDSRLLFPDEMDSFRAFQVPKKPQYALVSGIDAILLLRRDVPGLIAGEDADAQVMGEKGAVHAGGLKDLPSHAIFDRGRLIGLWEFDPERGDLVWSTFSKPDSALREAVKSTEAYVREQLGDARSFSLDSPKSRAPRIAALRKAG